MENLSRYLYLIVIFACISSLAGCQQGDGLPYPHSDLIRGVAIDWNSHSRRAVGSDNWPVTWGHDGEQYTAWGDGGGFGGSNTDGRVSLGVARVDGPAQAYSGANIWGGKHSRNPAEFGGKSYGIISIDSILYMWVSPGSDEQGYDEAKLYWSQDRGASWVAADWSFGKADRIVNPTFCQFGRDYDGARDNFVYMYASRVKDSSELKVQKPGEIMLMRAPVDALTDRSEYEFFVQLGEENRPVWSSDFDRHQPVFVDGNGVGWTASVSYNPALRRYLLITEHLRTARGHIGIFDAQEPWGPWTTAYYGMFAGSSRFPETTFFYNFSNKWLSPDGLQFVLVFTGVGVNDSWNTVSGTFGLYQPADRH